MSGQFDMEVTFNGLCLLWVKDAATKKSRPRVSEDLEVLLAPSHDGHHAHRADLCFRAEDWVGLEDGTALDVAPDGWEVVHVDLAGTRVEITTSSTGKRSTLAWASKKPRRRPYRPYEEGWLDWTLRAREIGIERIDPTAAACRVAMPPGSWHARDILRFPGSYKSALWKIPYPQQGVGVRSLARHFVHRARALDGVTVKVVDETGATKFDGDLFPVSGRLLRIAITNVPTMYHAPGEDDAALGHLTMFGAIGSGNPLQAPTVEKVGDTVRTACEGLLFY